VQFGVHVPQLGALGDPQTLVDLAQRAELAGWDGFFLWDHVMHANDPDACDPWVALGAIAATTSRLVLGPLVTPLPRRRPWKVARETTTLDRLANGRTVLGAGIGTDHYREFTAFSEPATDDRTRAAQLDEALTIITQLWTGERVSFTGEHYRVDDVVQRPRPVQQPRVPIWCAARWPARAPLRRAARWDGVVPLGAHTPDDVAALRAVVAEQRETTAPFAIALASDETASRDLTAYADAGATWWLAAIRPFDALADSRALVDGGPPRAG
jgi:alkanesulfonate monooxygenase SsuD/methylene tetrahydromethanopterin reductase-like flavin-dependent oxidoreductase (luciferase family)